MTRATSAGGRAALASAALFLGVGPLGLLSAAPSPRAEAQPELLDAGRIDAALEGALRDAELEPGPLCDDATFLRRISLDLRGTTPTLAEQRDFASDRAPAKRARWIARFQGEPASAAHLAEVLADDLLPRARDDELEPLRADFRAWLSAQLAAGRGWDALAAEIVAAEGRTGENPALGYVIAHVGFDLSGQEELAGTVLADFAGLSLDCAQCHDHPFSDFRQREYHDQAAFFSRLTLRELEGGELDFQVREAPLGEHRRTLLGSEGHQTFAPRLLRTKGRTLRPGQAPARHTATSRRAAFARWLTSPDNPWFARAAVNATWRRLLGQGLLETVEDPAGARHPAHAQLLDRLAQGLVSSGFSLPRLIGAILRSRAYQRSAAVHEPASALRAHFGAARLRPLRPRVLLEALLRAAGRDRPAPGALPRMHERFRAALLEELRGVTPAHRTGVESVTALQGLAAINGRLLTGLARSRTLQAARDSQGPEAGLTRLFRASLARPPRPAELRRLRGFLAAQAGSRAAWEDVFWSLLASSEFSSNH